MKKVIVALLILILSLSMVACQQNNNVEDEKKQVTPAINEGESEDSLKLASTLNTNICVNGNSFRTITYQQAEPLTLPDGTVIAQGDLKPVWQYIEDKLGFDIKDVAIQDQRSEEMLDIAASTGFTDATVYGGDTVSVDFMNYGAQGYFVDLAKNMDSLPNFSKYIEENPGVATAITAYDGGIYYIPYVAEIGNYARTYNVRETWVKALLDSEDALIDETATLEVKYEGFWDRNATNVVELQNQVANGGLNRDNALKILLDYIKETYPNLDKPSDLYLGKTAVYDMDELVALLRVVKLSPNTLTKLSTGKVVENPVISPFFIRRSRYREDILRFVSYFGGQRLYGSDSYFAQLYSDVDGKLHFSYAEDGFLQGVDKLRDMFAEGLIHSEFGDLSNTDDFRGAMYTRDKQEGQRQFGFMTNDWIASTTACNEDIVSVLPPVTTLPGFDEFVHFIENSRSIKQGGWAISTASSEEEINAAFKLIDYMFSEEGHILQNYGIPANLEENQTFVSPNGMEYPKFNKWLFDSANELRNGDVSGFLRDFMGSHIPIGYQKEIGFELQYTRNHGSEAWDLYESSDVLTTSYDPVDPYFKLMPPVISLTEQDTAKLSTLNVSNDQRDQILLYIACAENGPKDIEEIKNLYEEAGIEAYLELYEEAYARMLNK